MSPDLRKLLAWVEALSGPVDGVRAGGAANSFGPWPTESEEWHLFVRALGSDMSALGAAVALVEKRRPDWGWSVYHDNEAKVWNASKAGDGFLGSGNAATPVLALLTAFLGALLRVELSKSGGKDA